MIVCRCYVETEFVKLISLDGGVLIFNPWLLRFPLGYPISQKWEVVVSFYLYIMVDVCTYLSLKDSLEEEYNQPKPFVFIQFFFCVSHYLVTFYSLCNVNTYPHLIKFWKPVVFAARYFSRILIRQTNQKMPRVY